jgi:hypothetical protein
MNPSQFSLKFCSQNLINFSMFVRISGVLLHLTFKNITELTDSFYILLLTVTTLQSFTG